MHAFLILLGALVFLYLFETFAGLYHRATGRRDFGRKGWWDR